MTYFIQVYDLPKTPVYQLSEFNYEEILKRLLENSYDKTLFKLRVFTERETETISKDLAIPIIELEEAYNPLQIFKQKIFFAYLNIVENLRGLPANSLVERHIRDTLINTPKEIIKEMF